MGIAVSGDVDRTEGTVRYSPFLEWRDVPLAHLAAMTIGLPVAVDNDVRALTVAEQWFGAGVGLSDFALVTVCAGIGCGLVVGGRVVSGAHGVAGEIGHLSFDPAGPRRHCGNRIDVADAAQALELAHRGDPGAREVYARAGAVIGRAIGSVVNLLGPERVVISGEGLAVYDLFAERIRDTFDRVLRSPYDHERILPFFDNGDHLHPNDTGMQAMADAVQLDDLNCDRSAP